MTGKALTMISRRDFLRCTSSAVLWAVVPGSFPRPARAAGPTMPFAVGIVDAALGYSVIYEEYKGDYAEAERLAEQALADARRAAEPTTLADALRAQGAVSLLQGDAGRALALFEELETVVPDDAVRVRWARTYALAAFLLAYNTFPDGAPAAGDEVDLRRFYVPAGHRNMMDYLNRRTAAATGTPEQSASDFIVGKFWLLPLARSLAEAGRFRKHPAAQTDGIKVSPESTLNSVRGSAQMLGDRGLLAYLTLAEADVYRRQGDTTRANQLLAHAQESYGQNADTAGLASAWMLEGDWSAAPLSTPGALNLKVGVSPNSSSELTQDLELNPADIDPGKSRTAYARAEELYRQAGASRGLAAIQLRRSYLATLDGDYRSAEQAATNAADGFRARGDRLGYWCARIHEALARIGLGQFPEDRDTVHAIGQWGAAEGAFSYALGLGIICGGAGRHWILQAGDYERALSCHRLAESLYQALGAGIDEAQSIVDQGQVFLAVGEQAAALTALQRAVDLYRRIAERYQQPGNPAIRRAIEVTVDLFQVHAASRDPDGLEWVAGQAQTLLAQFTPKAGSPGGEGAASPLPGGLQAAIANQDEAMAALVVRLAESTVATVRVLAPTSRGIEARKRGEADEAERLFQAALAAAVQASGEGNDDPDFLQAIVHRARKDYPAAQRSFDRYVARQLTANDTTQAKLLELMRRIAPEQAASEEKKNMYRVHEQAVGFLVTIKAYQAAQAHLAALEDLAGKDWWKSREDPWNSLGDCGLLSEGLGEWREADSYYRRGIGALEGRRERLRRDELKTALASGMGPQYLYFQAARNALKEAAAAREGGDPERCRDFVEQGFGYAERGKARGLLDLMASGAVSASLDEGTSASMRAWRQVNAKLTTWRGLLAVERSRPQPEAARIASLAEQITAEEAKMREIESSLAASDPGFYQAINPQAALLDVKAIAAKLPKGTVMLQYSFLDEDLLAWAIDGHGVAHDHRGEVDAEALDRDIRTFHRRCESRTEVGSAGDRLAQALLAPFAEVLDTRADLVIVPYGAARLLPFHALPWKGAPLVATHSVSYLPSASTLQFVGRRGTSAVPDSVLAVGNPVAMAYQPSFGAPPEPQPPLPAAGVEAAHVAALFPKGRVLVGEAATAAAVREALPRYPLLHFATHGQLSEDAPLLSAILLANGEALTVYELLGLRLNADLVVLSACRTGQGKATGGDDVLGLTRGLLAAGARAAVVSLWPVDDLATSLLMEEFYKGLRRGKPPAVALQAAQNHLRSLNPEQARAERGRVLQTRGAPLSGLAPSAAADYSHPFFWAPFVLVG